MGKNKYKILNIISAVIALCLIVISISIAIVGFVLDNYILIDIAVIISLASIGVIGLRSIISFVGWLFEIKYKKNRKRDENEHVEK